MNKNSHEWNDWNNSLKNHTYPGCNNIPIPDIPQELFLKACQENKEKGIKMKAIKISNN